MRNKKKYVGLVYIVFIVYLGAALMISPLFLSYRYTSEVIINFLPLFGLALMIIGTISFLIKNLREKILRLLDFGDVLRRNGIHSIGTVDKDIAVYLHEILSNSEEIRMLINPNFEVPNLELTLSALILDSNKIISTIVVNTENQNLDIITSNHLVKSLYLSNSKIRTCNKEFCNNIILFRGGVIVFYNTNLENSLVLYTVINSFNPDYNQYLALFDKFWLQSIELER
jgi:hypothetical protein